MWIFAAGVNSGLYKFLLLVHVLAAIVGFGAVTLNAVYGVQAKKRGPSQGLAIAEANFVVSAIGEKFIYAVPVLGVLLVVASDDAWHFDDTWVLASLVVYAVGIAISHLVVLPTAKKMLSLLREVAAAPVSSDGPPPQAATLAALEKRIGAASMLLHLALVTILVLMIWKP